MRIFIAGAMGTLGRPVVRRLVSLGHEVVGLTRSEKGARALEAAGARGVIGDALDREGLRAAVVAARPEQILHLLTALPPVILRARLNKSLAHFAGDLLRLLVDAHAQGRGFEEELLQLAVAVLLAKDAPVGLDLAHFDAQGEDLGLEHHPLGRQVGGLTSRSASTSSRKTLAPHCSGDISHSLLQNTLTYPHQRYLRRTLWPLTGGASRLVQGYGSAVCLFWLNAEEGEPKIEKRIAMLTCLFSMVRRTFLR